jgi:hypothetical protein
VARRESPPPPGPLGDFARDLRDLRAAAGTPSHRELARRAHYSASTVAAAAFMQDRLSAEETRKNSLEQRGLAVITTRGASLRETDDRRAVVLLGAMAAEVLGVALLVATLSVVAVGSL